MRRGALGAGLPLALIAGCGGGGGHGASSPARPPARPPAPRLADPRPCSGAPGFTCSSFAVPLDHTGRAAGTLRLSVAVAGEASAPLGTLVFLTGGPGQPGVPFATRTRRLLGSLASRLRIVLLDQRGTGAGALRCPALQAAVGTSDLTVPPAGAVEACAGQLGERRRFYSTADTAVVRRDPRGGPALLDTIVALSVGAPSFPSVAAALHAARAGRPAALERLVAAVGRAQAAPPAFFSAGLHAATLCADLRAPWAGPAAPAAGRAAAVARAAARNDAAPFDRRTVRANGLIATCERWPPTPAPRAPATGSLPPVPALLLAGARDLSTPLAWARAQLVRTPRGRLVVVRSAGHSLQSRAAPPEGRRAVLAFLRQGP